MAKGILQIGLNKYLEIDYSGLSGWAPCNHKGLLRGRKEGLIRERAEDVTLLLSQIEGGATSQGMRVASKKRQGSRLFPRASRRNAALRIL